MLKYNSLPSRSRVFFITNTSPSLAVILVLIAAFWFFFTLRLGIGFSKRYGSFKHPSENSLLNFFPFSVNASRSSLIASGTFCPVDKQYRLLSSSMLNGFIVDIIPSISVFISLLSFCILYGFSYFTTSSGDLKPAWCERVLTMALLVDLVIIHLVRVESVGNADIPVLAASALTVCSNVSLNVSLNTTIMYAYVPSRIKKLNYTQSNQQYWRHLL